MAFHLLVGSLHPVDLGQPNLAQVKIIGRDILHNFSNTHCDFVRSNYCTLGESQSSSSLMHTLKGP